MFPLHKSRNLREAYVVETVSDTRATEAGENGCAISKSVDDDVSLTRGDDPDCSLDEKTLSYADCIDAVNCFTPVGSKEARRGQRKNPFAEEKGESDRR